MSRRTGSHRTENRRARNPRARTPRAQNPRAGDRRGLLWTVASITGGLVALFAIYLVGHTGDSSPGYQVARPATGENAPEFTLPSAQGGTVDLATLRGKGVLLFFQEGIGCEPCWQQARDLEGATAQLHAVGIDRIVTITTNTLDQLRQKAADEGLTAPVLADPGFAVSRAYNANAYGMMGASADGHTFVVVGPDGTIRWRADYGGPPKYTMYVSVQQILSDLAKATGSAR